MSHIFISYSKRDIEFARHLRKLLQDKGFPVWMDERLVDQERSWPTIEENIATCSALIVIMSPNSHKSRWVEYEISAAGRPENQKPIFAILLAGEAWELLGGQYEYENMTEGLNAVLSHKFVEGLKKFVQPFVNTNLPKPLRDETLEAQQIKETSQFSRFVMPISIGLNVILAIVAIFTSSIFSLNPIQPSVTPSSTATNTPRPATSTAAPTATLAAITQRDYVFELSDSSIWEYDQIAPLTVPHAYRAVGTDPFIETRALNICLADYRDIYLQISSPLGEEIQVYLLLKDDIYDNFNGERAVILENYTQEGFASYTYAIEQMRFLEADSRLEGIRIHLGNSGAIWYLFDFRLIRDDAESISRCN